MREPTLTIMPPSKPGSTRTSIATRRPTVRRSCSPSAASCASLKRLGRDDFGGDLAAPRGELGEIGLDHRRHRKEAPVAGDDREKIAHQPRQPGALGHGGDRLCLRRARQDRAADQAHEVGARGQHGPQLAQIGGDLVERAALVGDIEQRRRITFGQGGNACRFGSQGGAVLDRRKLPKARAIPDGFRVAAARHRNSAGAVA